MKHEDSNLAAHHSLSDLHESKAAGSLRGIPDNVMRRDLSELREDAVECVVGNIVIYVLNVKISIRNNW